MKGRILTLILVLSAALNPRAFGKGNPPYEAIIIYPSAPNPCSDKCLIRFYIPENDPYASIRILSAGDSTLIKELPLASDVGIGSEPVNCSDLKPGNYLYQFFYKGETRKTLSFTVKRDSI